MYIWLQWLHFHMAESDVPIFWCVLSLHLYEYLLKNIPMNNSIYHLIVFLFMPAVRKA